MRNDAARNEAVSCANAGTCGAAGRGAAGRGGAAGKDATAGPSGAAGWGDVVRRQRGVGGALVRLWAYAGIALAVGVAAALFGYVFYKGYSTLSWEFLTEAPSGLILGEEGGIFPAIVGSLWFTTTAVVLGGIPAIATAVYMVFYCRRPRLGGTMRLVIQCLAGVPSIVLGLFAYSFLVRDVGWGRCVLSGGVALALMVLPFIEVRAEKAFRELPRSMVRSSYALGCTKFHTVLRIALPACRGELVSALVLGACYACGATAPLMFTGAVAYAGLPGSVFEPAMALPMHLYLLVAQGGSSLDTAFGTAFVMMAIVLASSLVATVYARRSQERWGRS